MTTILISIVAVTLLMVPTVIAISTMCAVISEMMNDDSN